MKISKTLEKQKAFHKIFLSYNQSIKSLFNMSSTDVESWLDKNNHFKICNFSYKTCITRDFFSNWVRRHAFIDIFELTREILFKTIVELFHEDLSFHKKIASARKEIRKKRHLNLDVSDLLEILGINKKFLKFINTFTQYKKVRNSLNHRFGEVSHNDQPPIFLNFYTIDYGIQHGENIDYFKTLEEANQIIAKNPTHHEHHIVLKFNPQTKKYASGDKIIITNDIIYGTAGYIYSNIQNIFREIFSKEIVDLERILTKSDPFKMKCKITLKKPL